MEKELFVQNFIFYHLKYWLTGGGRHPVCVCVCACVCVCVRVRVYTHTHTSVNMTRIKTWYRFTISYMKHECILMFWWKILWFNRINRLTFRGSRLATKISIYLMYIISNMCIYIYIIVFLGNKLIRILI